MLSQNDLDDLKAKSDRIVQDSVNKLSAQFDAMIKQARADAVAKASQQWTTTEMALLVAFLFLCLSGVMFVVTKHIHDIRKPEITCAEAADIQQGLYFPPDINDPTPTTGE